VHLTLAFPPQDIEVTSSPDDSIGCLSFSPPTLPGNFLIAGSWANDVSASQATAMLASLPALQLHSVWVN
jgi:mRNA export factor